MTAAAIKKLHLKGVWWSYSKVENEFHEHQPDAPIHSNLRL